MRSDQKLLIPSLTTALRPPAFLLERYFEPSNLTTVRSEQTYTDGTQQERDIPTADVTSIKATLYIIQEFTETAAELDFDTGLELLFRNFHLVLTGDPKEDWITTLQVQAPPPTEVGFWTTLADWKRTFLYHVDQ